MKQHKKKRGDYADDPKPHTSRYALKRKQGCEINHKRHVVPVAHCSLCKWE